MAWHSRVLQLKSANTRCVQNLNANVLPTAVYFTTICILLQRFDCSHLIGITFALPLSIIYARARAQCVAEIKAHSTSCQHLQMSWLAQRPMYYILFLFLL